jgi:hypothetical protein
VHVVLHVDPPQTYGAQEIDCDPTHAPAPLQLPTVVAVPAVQPAPHALPLGSEHALRSDPLQLAAEHAGSPVPGVQAGRAPCGAPVTGVHTPAEPARLQASHWPPHAALQQRPSAQKPLAHCPFDVHGEPMGSMHVPAKPATLQCALVGQVDDEQQVPSTQLPEVH